MVAVEGEEADMGGPSVEASCFDRRPLQSLMCAHAPCMSPWKWTVGLVLLGSFSSGLGARVAGRRLLCIECGVF